MVFAFSIGEARANQLRVKMPAASGGHKASEHPGRGRSGAWTICIVSMALVLPARLTQQAGFSMEARQFQDTSGPLAGHDPRDGSYSTG
jgi:hypothetical protein